MKSNTFNYSLLAVGVAALMGVSTGAIAATSGTVGETTTEVTITNKASAKYSVGSVEQPDVESNEVIIKVSEQVSFSLVSNNEDESAGNDSNVNEEVAPNGFASFEHTLTNTGNRSDTFNVKLENVTEDDSQYNLTASTVSYQLYNADKTAVSGASGTDISITTFNDPAFTFPLEAGQYVKFTINAKTNDNKGGNTQDLLLSATSTILTNTAIAGTKATLTNTDSSVTKLPSFSIVKTMTNGLDLNDDTDTASYKIQIKNIASAYSTAATDVTIGDFLPAGLVLASGLTTSNITASGSATKGAIASSNAGDDGFSITGIDIPVGETITIEFDVIKGGSGTLDLATALNHVDVTDDLDDDATTDNTLIDSTKKANEQNVTEFYVGTEENYTDGTTANIDDRNDSTQPLLTIKRDLVLTGPTTKQVPPTTNSDGSGEATHTATITNSGQEKEGDALGELIFTLTDTNATTPGTVNVVPSKVKVIYEGVEYLLPAVNAVDGVYTYDIKNAVAADSTKFPGIAPGDTADIQYNVASNGATIGITDAENAEKIIVTLLPKGEGSPTVPAITDTTQVRGLLLFKTQSLDANCDGTSDDGKFVDTEIDAVPGQCVVYKIKAENNSDTTKGFDINTLVISDLLSNFEAQASVKEITNKSPWTTLGNNASGLTEPANVTATEVRTKIAELKPTGTATLDFTIEIKTNRLTTP